MDKDSQKAIPYRDYLIVEDEGTELWQVLAKSGGKGWHPVVRP